jgi:hypothetical protein
MVPRATGSSAPHYHMAVALFSCGIRLLLLLFSLLEEAKLRRIWDLGVACPAVTMSGD